MDFKVFEYSLEADEGRWFEIGDAGERIKVRSDESELYTKVLRGVLDSHPNWRKLPRKVQDRLFIKAIASGLLLDWDGMTDNGVPIEPTQENKEEMLTKYPSFRRLVSDLAGSVANFQRAPEQD